MNTLDAISGRRSVRSFRNDPIPDDILDQLLQAGNMAASASNAQPWVFILIRNKRRLKAINALSPGINGEPPALIVICVNKGEGKDPDQSLITGFVWMSIGCATQNMLLAAYDLGLGACPVASFHQEAISVILNLPEFIQPVLLIALGYSQILPDPPQKRSTDDICFVEQYGKRYER